jgi:putative membrane-bound dehydrogenase-like protein
MVLLCLLVAGGRHGSCARADEAPGPSAADLLRDVKAPEGFAATVFAGPDLARYPVFVAATVDGTLFVSSDGNGSLDREPHRGRILRLRDTDQDGTADEVKEFVTDVNSPRGLVWVDDRLIVLHPPHVSAFRDTDGDGTADEQTRLVSDLGFGFADRPADHTSNGLALGIDGWVYAAIGDFGFRDASGSDGRHLHLRGGGIVRFRPDGSGLDLFARGTRNNLEAAVGPLLQMIARDNTNDGGGWNVRLHSFSGLEDHGYPRRYLHFAAEIVAPLADYGGGSGTGACWIDEPWMPARWNDAPFTCDWGRGLIYRHPLAAQGAGFTAEQEEFLHLTRVTDLDADGAGTIYAASWRDGTFTWTGPHVGFIAALRPTGRLPLTPPDCSALDSQALCHLLAGPSHRIRLEAQRQLLRRGDRSPEILQALEAQASEEAAALAPRVAALFTCALLGQGAARPALVRLADDAALAPFAIRALGDLGTSETEARSTDSAVRDLFKGALAAPDPRTRLEAIVALVRNGSGAAWLLPLAADADPIVAHTAIEGAVRLGTRDQQQSIAACAAALEAPEETAALRGACRVLGELHTPEVAELVVARLDRLGDQKSAASGDSAGGSATLREELVWAASRLYRREGAWPGESWGGRPDARGPYYAAEEWAASPHLLAALLSAVTPAELSSLPKIGQILGAHRLPVESIAPELLKRAADGPPGAVGLARFLDLEGSAWPPANGVLESLSLNSDVAPADRLVAIRVLSRSPAPELLRPLVAATLALEPGSAAAVAARLAVRESLAAAADPRAAEALAEGNQNSNQEPSRAQRGLVDDILLYVAASSSAKSAPRAQAAGILDAAWQAGPARRLELVAASARTASGVLSHKLVAAAEQNDEPDLKALAGETILKLGIDAEGVRRVAADAGPKVSERPTGAVLDLVDARRGDRGVGAELFVARKCISCHAAGVDSSGLGPSLANAASIYSRRQLAQSVLEPSKSLAQGFATVLLELADGRPLVGFVTSEAAGMVVLRDGSGVEHRVNKSEIEERAQLPTSVMPEGLVNDLSIAQFASLLDYIETLGK